jgi:hypothetical protein
MCGLNSDSLIRSQPFVDEETNSGSWDIAAEFIGALGKMLGVSPSGRFCEADHCDAIGGPDEAM